jgi:ribosome maturation factor RimP
MKKSIKETAREVILPTVTELGYEIWDVTYSKIGADYHLEITIDNDEGINIDDCERVHRAIDPILDECDPIEGFYYLEVSSPGVERELRTDEHITLSVGARVNAKLFTAKDGVKAVVGKLLSYEDGVIVIENDAGKTELLKNEIAKINTVYFDE